MSPQWHAQQQRSGLYVARAKRQVGFTRAQDRMELNIEPPEDDGDAYAVADEWVEVEEEA